jgi:hypothetical protein
MNKDAFDREIIWGEGGLVGGGFCVEGGVVVGGESSAGAFSAIEVSGDVMHSMTQNANKIPKELRRGGN